MISFSLLTLSMQRETQTCPAPRHTVTDPAGSGLPSSRCVCCVTCLQLLGLVSVAFECLVLPPGTMGKGQTKALLGTISEGGNRLDVPKSCNWIGDWSTRLPGSKDWVSRGSTQPHCRAGRLSQVLLRRQETTLPKAMAATGTSKDMTD